MAAAAETPGTVRCARCGAPFVCGKFAGERPCWCASLPAVVPEPGLGCLCRSCLEEALREAARRTERKR